ncbi:MAG: hypothetical protein ACYS6K_28925 [Planctomycetota bacterium]|jgi:hypothetical protein
MRETDNMKKLIKKLRFEATADTHERILGNVLKALEISEQEKSAAPMPSIRRIIMKSKITKLAAAAVIIVGVALLITVVDKLTSPAYAIEQTIKAFENVQYMHIVRRDKAGNIEDERWIEIGPDGIQARYRQDTPERNFFVVDDRQTVMVHHPDKKTVVLYDANEKCWTWIYAPGKVFQELADGGTTLRKTCGTKADRRIICDGLSLTLISTSTRKPGCRLPTETTKLTMKKTRKVLSRLSFLTALWWWIKDPARHLLRNRSG